MKILSVLLVGLVLGMNPEAQTQPKPALTQNQTIVQSAELPAAKPWKPELRLQDALKIAEHYIAKQKIDVSPYYLAEARFILYGGKDTGDPSWFFRWDHEDGALGNYLQVVVSIKTRTPRLQPAM
jgi:hypothetical protein